MAEYHSPGSLPPSLASLDTGETPAPTRPKSVLKFDDPFSPSEASFDEGEISSAYNRPRNRHTVYNTQVVETFCNAIARAVELGFPHIEPPFALSYQRPDQQLWDAYHDAQDLIEPTLEEGSDDWLCVQCYIRYLMACHLAQEGNPSPDPITVLMAAEEMFFAGAAARQLELSRRNRRDALRGKKTLASAKDAGAITGQQHAERSAEILAAMDKYVKQGKSVRNAAQLCANGGIGSSASANRKMWDRRK